MQDDKELTRDEKKILRTIASSYVGKDGRIHSYYDRIIMFAWLGFCVLAVIVVGLVLAVVVNYVLR